jgi:hypothetical protein
MIFMRCLAARHLVSIRLLCIARSVVQQTLALEHEPTVVPGKGSNPDVACREIFITVRPDLVKNLIFRVLRQPCVMRSLLSRIPVAAATARIDRHPHAQ